MNLKKELSGVAEIAAQIMDEQLKGQQHKIDANKNNKIDAHDFKILRAQKDKEKANSLKYGKQVKEEQEQIDEMGYSATAARAGKDIGKPGKMFSKIAASAAKKYGSEERGKKVAGAVLAKLRMKEDVEHDITDEEVEEILTAYEETPKTFSEMMAAYKEDGLAFFAEEPTQDEYEKEIKKAQAKSEGKEKADVAAAAVQAVKNEETHTKIQVIDMTDPNNIQKSEIDLEERTLTEPEAKKKEEIVKSMKKKMPGFKERYGERAKSVMYATATKLAKKD